MLRNVGTGEVVCPVFVKSNTGTVKVLVTVGSESGTRFTASTKSRPHTVLLDPDGTCHRELPAAGIAGERVDLLE